LDRQRRAAARARLIRRRRAGVVLATLVLVAVIVVACNAVGAATRKHSTTPPATGANKTTTTTRVTTTTVLPASFDVGLHTFDWDETGPSITHVGPTGQALAGRVLTTEVRYPTEAGSAGTETVNARPTTVGGPYPVIVFAHGWNTEPSDYEGLLDSWVKAGFVVVSPIFPDESSTAVGAAGGPGSAAASTEETDAYNEPGDIVYVLKQLEVVSSLPWGGNLKGVLNLSDVGLAGQSDGGNVVGALAYGPGLAKVYGELPVAPKAVAVMSGVPWYDWNGAAVGTYTASAASPALLQIQSDADGCVPPLQGPTYLFSAVQAGLTAKWWVTLLGADHLAPFEGSAPWASVVDAVTTQFFELELGWRSSSLTGASILSAGTVSGVAQATTTVSSATVPQVALIGGC
jgi:hypothetical protein